MVSTAIEKAALSAASTAYNANLDLASKSVAKMVMDVVTKLGAGNLQEGLEAAYPELVAQHSYVHANVALELYQNMRDAAGMNDGHTVEISYDSLYKMATGFARADLEDIVDWADTDGVTQQLQGSIVKDCGTIADRTLLSWARHDPAKPKWALVPEPGACAWCNMIASRGFVYSTEKTLAPVRHPNCRCESVVSFSKHPKVSGYDPEALRETYRKALSNASGDDAHDERNDMLRQMNKDSGYWRNKYQLKLKNDAGDASTT
jgi:hypothetical protein